MSLTSDVCTKRNVATYYVLFVLGNDVEKDLNDQTDLKRMCIASSKFMHKNNIVLQTRKGSC